MHWNCQELFHPSGKEHLEFLYTHRHQGAPGTLTFGIKSSVQQCSSLISLWVSEIRLTLLYITTTLT